VCAVVGISLDEYHSHQQARRSCPSKNFEYSTGLYGYQICRQENARQITVGRSLAARDVIDRPSSPVRRGAVREVWWRDAVNVIPCTFIPNSASCSHPLVAMGPFVRNQHEIYGAREWEHALGLEH